MMNLMMYIPYFCRTDFLLKRIMFRAIFSNYVYTHTTTTVMNVLILMIIATNKRQGLFRVLAEAETMAANDGTASTNAMTCSVGQSTADGSSWMEQTQYIARYS